MNLLEQLKATTPSKQEPMAATAKNAASHAARKRNMRARYRTAFAGKQKTAREISLILGITPVGALNGLISLEEGKCVKRVGTRETGGTRPAIVWEWIKGE